MTHPPDVSAADLSTTERASAEVTRLFVGLTPDRVLAAVDAAGLETTGLCYPLNSFENRVYEVELADRSRVVAKFYRPGRWRRGQVEAEHRFLAALAAEEIPACPALPFPDGGTVATIDGILYSLWRRQGGRVPDELDPATAARLGRLVARVHTVGSRLADSDRPDLDADRYARQPVAWMAESGVLPPSIRDRYLTAAAAIADAYEQQVDGVGRHLLHGDLHLGNLLRRDGLLWLVDFDDACLGPPVQDLWLAVPGRDEESLRLRQALLAGYEELRELDRSTLALIEPLRGLRMIRYTGWIARRWHDPAFPAAWPEFGSDDFWRTATDDLEAQARALGTRPDPRATVDLGARLPEPPEDPSELTNADYFWDWEN